MTMTTIKEDKMPGDLPFNILTDLASPATWSKVAEQARNRTPALDELFLMIERRQILGPEGQKIPLGDDAVTLQQAELLFYLTIETKPILSIETGFAFGLVAGVITIGHMLNELNGGHVPIQDHARQTEDGIGAHTMERLELTGYQIMEHEPALVLPQMYLQELNQGMRLVYLNSADNFEEQMMEYFYLNKLLNEGGIMAINTNAASRRDLVDYIRRERHDYAVRALSCGITLVQKPATSEWAQHNNSIKH